MTGKEKISERRIDIVLGEMICPICGKIFYSRGAWGYHGQNGRKVCSYPCSVKDGETTMSKSKRLAVDMYDTDGNLIESFRSVHDAMLHTGIKQIIIRNCATGRTKYTRYDGKQIIFRYKKQEG